MKSFPLFLVSIFLFQIASKVGAFGVKSTDNCGSTSSRSEFVAILAGTVASIPVVAFAKDEESKGSKKDPEFEACLSKCLYECTKPKGAEQKSRKECLPECRASCATTKAQLMTGVPKAD